MDEVQQQGQINIELGEKEAEGNYSNLAIISHSGAEFIIDFTRIFPGIPKAKVHSRIIMTPQHCKMFLNADIFKVPKLAKTKNIAVINPKSPILLTIKAFLAASPVNFFSDQKPIRRYEQSPTPSHPRKTTRKLSAITGSIAGFAVNTPLLVTIALLFFVGATGKSAQIPLFVWLPDAMAGPTPVSALIHAATMVTAGIYLIARTSLLYALAPTASTVILIVGIATAIISATIALKQNDIKKILAYSTVSQLGFMFIALGTHSYVAAVFHLVTHAFFKALMFLGSGSVIHGMHDEQDIRNMGGLKDKMKITYITFLIGAIAISGIPPFAGFFSKDEILYKTFINAGILPYLLVLLTAGFTAFYMFRLIGLTFFGKPRYDSHVHPHESPSTMTIPLIILAVLSVFGGFIGLPQILGYNVLEHWFEPVFKGAEMVIQGYHPDTEHSAAVEIILIFVSIIVASTAIFISFKKFSKQEVFPEEKGLGKVLENKYYLDEIYDATVVNPIFKTSESFLYKIFDVRIIDGLVNGVARFSARLSFDWRKIQSGIIHDYAALAVTGVILIVLFFLFK